MVPKHGLVFLCITFWNKVTWVTSTSYEREKKPISCTKQSALGPSGQTLRNLFYVPVYNNNLQMCLHMDVVSKMLMLRTLKYSKAEGT